MCSYLTSFLSSRCLAGALNGNVGVIKSMMAEITDSTNIAQGIIAVLIALWSKCLHSSRLGFALMPVVWSVGSTIGYCFFITSIKNTFDY